MSTAKELIRFNTACWNKPARSCFRYLVLITAVKANDWLNGLHAFTIHNHFPSTYMSAIMLQCTKKRRISLA